MYLVPVIYFVDLREHHFNLKGGGKLVVAASYLVSKFDGKFFLSST